MNEGVVSLSTSCCGNFRNRGGNSPRVTPALWQRLSPSPRKTWLSSQDAIANWLS
jgi:hypothetical protein